MRILAAMGNGTSLSHVDAAWRNMDRPNNTADVVALFLFSRPLAPEFFERLIETRLLRHARFRERAVVTGFPGRTGWEADTNFLLSRHLVTHRLRGQSQAALRELVSEVASEPLDLHHAPWRMHFIESFGGGSAAVAKLHHCLGDGAALVSLLFSLADEDGLPPRPPKPAAIPPWREAARLVSEGVGLTRSLARMAMLPPDPVTQLRTPLSGRRQVAWSRPLPLDPLRRAAHREKATVNDLLLAALAGALRRQLGDGQDDLRALVPVSLRSSGRVGEELGNQFGLVFVDLPVSLLTFSARLEAIRRTMTALKASSDAVASYGLLGALGLGPELVQRQVADYFTRRASLVVTNVHGPRERFHFGGAEIERLMFWVPHPALLGLGVSLFSYGGELSFGVRADEAVLRHPTTLVRHFMQELRPYLTPPKRRRQVSVVPPIGMPEVLPPDGPAPGPA